MSGDFDGKVAVVTGGASGIGRATAELLAERGASVLIADLNGDAAAEAAGALEGAEAIACDVGDPGSVEEAVNAAVESFGGLDVMVNNAGVGLAAALTETTTEDAERVLRVNLLGVFHGIRSAAPRIAERGGGAIVSTASAAGLRGAPIQAVYGASKAGVINLTQGAAIELRPLNIRVNCVCPGIIRTPMLEQLEDAVAELMPITVDELIAAKQVRGGEPADIARAVAYLASDRADFVSGVALPVDNAFSASIF
jgi:NAD(P)-dependent dehydrogenase (short-subunit alcohol dehydrogenase family)